MRSLFQLLGALGLTALVLLGWLVVRLADGPVSLSFLLPYLETALSRPDGSLNIRINDTVLEWDRENHILDVKALNSRAVGADGQVIAVLPELSFTLSVTSLLHGEVVPRVVRVLHPAIRLIRDQDGGLRFSVAPAAPQAAPSPINAGGQDDGLPLSTDSLATLLAPGGGADSLGRLQRIEVAGGTLVVDDRRLGALWRFPAIELNLVRSVEGFAAHGHFDLDFDGHSAALDVNGTYGWKTRVVDATASVDGVRLAPFAAVSPQLAPLAALQLPISGRVTVRALIDQGLSAVTVDLAGGPGTIDAMDLLGSKRRSSGCRCAVATISRPIAPYLRL